MELGVSDQAGNQGAIGKAAHLPGGLAPTGELLAKGRRGRGLEPSGVDLPAARASRIIVNSTAMTFDMACWTLWSAAGVTRTPVCP